MTNMDPKKWDAIEFDGDEGMVTKATVIIPNESFLVGFLPSEHDDDAMTVVRGDGSVIVFRADGVMACRWGLKSLMGFLKEVEDRLLKSKARGKGWIE